jgi:hypothetical protein
MENQISIFLKDARSRKSSADQCPVELCELPGDILPGDFKFQLKGSQRIRYGKTYAGRKEESLLNLRT